MKKSKISSPSIRLSIELVPSSCWFSNLRAHLLLADWDRIRKASYAKANYRCEICNGVGSKWPVECHEIWAYNDKKRIQKLDGVIALCPDCHSVKHFGLAQIQGKHVIAEAHLAKVNGWTAAEAANYVELSFKTWERRSQFDWQLDLDWLDPQGIKPVTRR